MSVLNKIAFFQNRRDELPNQELAHELAHTRSNADIREIAGNLWNKEANVQSDCLKVLYEIGYLAPDLIAEYTDDFLELLNQDSNRLVWGGMIALSTIAALKADELIGHLPEILKAMEKGTVITNDAGMRILSAIAAQNESAHDRIVPYLLQRLADCRAVDAPRYAETIAPTIDPTYREQFVQILEKWSGSASPARLARLRKVLKAAQSAWTG